MSHKQKKHYPDMALVRRKARQVCHAVHALTEQGIEVQTVSFKSNAPVIEIENCPSNQSLHGVSSGQSRAGEGELHIKKTTFLYGCLINWSEAV